VGLRAALLSLWSLTLFIQSTKGQARIPGPGGTPVAHLASNIIGISETNQTFSLANTTVQFMRYPYSPFQQNTAIPTASADNCSVASGGSFYLIGGYTVNGTAITNVQIYNAGSDSWSSGTVIPTGTWGSACALYNGKIYVFGGSVTGNTPTTNAYAYDIAGNSWTSLSALPAALANGVMAVNVGSLIYILRLGTFESYNPANDTYTTLTTPPTAAKVEWAATGYVNVSGDDRIYFLGGSTADGTGYGNGVYYYSVTNATWSAAQATAPFSAHGQIQNAVYNGLIYYLAGFDGNYFYQDLYSYNPSSNTWSSKIVSMNHARDGVGGGFYGNTIFAIGGRDAITSPFGLTDNESFQIGSSPGAQTFTKIQLLYNQVSPSGTVRLGIYADSSGTPGSLLLDAGAATIVNGWTAIGSLSFNPTVGTYYWLAFIHSATNGVSYTGGPMFNGTKGNHCNLTGQTYGPLPSSGSSAVCNIASNYVIRLTLN